jgi:hypothetical protein
LDQMISLLLLDIRFRSKSFVGPLFALEPQRLRRLFAPLLIWKQG